MGFLDFFKKKNNIVKSINSSISTTNKILNTTTPIVKEKGKEFYELGMKYLNTYPINFDLARENFKKALNEGYIQAEKAAQVIGLEYETTLTPFNFIELNQIAAENFRNDRRRIGDLVYINTYDLKYNIFNTSSDPDYYASRFVDYEIYCMRKYGNDEVKHFHDNSSLKDWEIQFSNEWDNFRMSSHSEYLNEKSFPMISRLTGISMISGEMGVLRAAIVADILDNYYFVQK